MGYRRRSPYSSSSNADGCLIWGGIFLLVLTIEFFKNPIFDIEGILVVTVWIVILIAVLYEPSIKYYKKYKMRVRECEHGVIGAFLNKNLCADCSLNESIKEVLIKKIELLNTEKNHTIEKKNKLLRNNENKILKKLNTDIEYLRKMDPFEFEHQVSTVFKKLGYNTEVTSKTNDEGKDIILRKNGEITYVECKRFTKKNKVSRPILQKLYGVMVADNVNKGIVVTTTSFTNESIEFSKKMNGSIRLVDEKEIIKLFKETSNIEDSKLRYTQICECNLNISEIDLYELTISELENYIEKYNHHCGEEISFSLDDIEKKCNNNHINLNRGKVFYVNLLDENENYNKEFCPMCGGQLNKKKQRNTNKKFWGCSNYPKCTYTKSIR